MKYERLENEIIQALTPGLMSGVDVLALPENPADFAKVSRNGKITVCYIASKFSEPKSFNQISQDETASFEIIVEDSKLRGTRGVYALIEKIHSLILGKRLTGTNKLYLVNQDLSVPKDGQTSAFAYSLTVACKLIIVEEIEAVEPPYPEYS